MKHMRDGRPQLAAQKRTVVGKKVRFLRREGWTPANVFGHGIDSIAVQVHTRDLEHTLAHVSRNSLFSLEMEGSTPTTVLIKDVTRKPTTGELYHVDFYHVSMTEKLRTTVPLILSGTAPAAETYDAVILHAMDALHVECLPGDLPGQIMVDLARLVEVDDALFVRDLDLPSGVTALVSEDELVVKALAPKIAEELAEEAAEAEAAAEAVAAEAPEPAAAETAEEAPAAEAAEQESTESGQS
jgi:large subunit ribosomal protein L25